MGTKKAGGVPARLESTRRRFERWRRTRTLGTRIPEPLWASAVKMAGRYGINQTAKTLGLDYNGVKKRLEQQVASRTSAPANTAIASENNAMATFLELAPAGRFGPAECILELEDAEGAKMRIHLKGIEGPDLAALSRSLWVSQSCSRPHPRCGS